MVFSDKARTRAEATLKKAVKKERETIDKQLWHLSNQAFSCQNDAAHAGQSCAKQWQYHQVSEQHVTQKGKHTGRGRPKKGAQPSQLEYFIHASAVEDKTVISERLDEKSWDVLGTNIESSALSDREVISAYKQQNTSIENMGFRFLKDPVFFASSLFLKKPSRIMGLLMVMTLALLVYSIAQRRMRKALEAQNETLPNQINEPTQKPTMRWVFQLMTGIHSVTMKLKDGIQAGVQGITIIQEKIIRLMGETTVQIYDLHKKDFSPAGGTPM